MLKVKLWSSVLLAAFVLATGCGYSTYEERLQKSARFYEYLSLLDQNLSRTAWNRPDREMSMRVPLPFGAPLPAPPPPRQDAEGNVVIEPETRHPFVLGIELEGIVEAWQSQLQDANGTPVTSLLYVLTNQDRFLNPGTGAPAAGGFLNDLEGQLAAAFQVGIPAGEINTPGDNARYRVKVPGRNSPAAPFCLPHDYTAIHFIPSGPVGGQSVKAMLYEFEAGQIQGAVLCICPVSVSPQFRDRLEMALQTLQIPSRIPTASTSSGGKVPSAGPAGF